MGDKPQALKDIYMMVDFYKNWPYANEGGKTNECKNENQASFFKADSKRD